MISADPEMVALFVAMLQERDTQRGATQAAPPDEPHADITEIYWYDEVHPCDAECSSDRCRCHVLLDQFDKFQLNGLSWHIHVGLDK